MRGRPARESDADDGSLKAMYLSFAALLVYDQGNSSYIAAPAMEYIAKKLSDTQTVLTENDTKELAMKEVSKYALFDESRAKEMERRSRFVDAANTLSNEKGAMVTILKKNEYTTSFPTRRRSSTKVEKILKDGSERLTRSVSIGRNGRPRRPMRPAGSFPGDVVNRIVVDDIDDEAPQRSPSSTASRIMSDIGLEVLGVIQSAGEITKNLIKTPTDALNWLSKQLYALGGLYWKSIGAPLIGAKKDKVEPESAEEEKPANIAPIATDPDVKQAQKRRRVKNDAKFDAHMLLRNILNMFREYCYSTNVPASVEYKNLLATINESLTLVDRLEKTVKPNVHYDRHIVAIVSFMNDHFKKALSENNNSGGDVDSVWDSAGKNKEKEPVARTPVIDEASKKLLALFDRFDRRLVDALEKVYSTEHGYVPGESINPAEFLRKTKTEKANLEARMEEAITRLNDHAKMINAVLEVTDPKRDGAMLYSEPVEGYAMVNFDKIIEAYKESKKLSKTSANATTATTTTSLATSVGVEKPIEKLRDEDMRRIYEFFGIPVVTSTENNGEQLHHVLEKTLEHIEAFRKINNKKSIITAKLVEKAFEGVKKGLLAANHVLRTIVQTMNDKRISESLDVQIGDVKLLSPPLSEELQKLYEIIKVTIDEYNTQKQKYAERESEWKEDLKNYRDSNKTLTISKNEIEKKLKAADEKNAASETAKTALSVEVDEYKSKRESEMKKLVDLEIQLRTSTEKIETLESGITRLNSKLKDVEAKSKAEASQFEKDAARSAQQLSETANQNKAIITKMEKEIEDLTNSRKTEMDKYLTEITKLKNESTSSHESASELKQKISKLKEERKAELLKYDTLLKELEKSKVELTNNQKAQETMSVSHKTEITSLNDKLDTANTNLLDAKTAIDNMKIEYASKETELQSLRASVGGKDARIKILEEENFAKKSEYEAQVEKMNAERKALESSHANEKESWTANSLEQTERLRTLEESVENSRKEMERVKLELDTVKKEFTTANALSNALETEKDKLLGNIKTLEVQKNELQKTVEDLIRQVSELTDNVSKTKQELEDKEKKLEISQKELSECRAERDTIQKRANSAEDNINTLYTAFLADFGDNVTAEQLSQKTTPDKTEKSASLIERYKTIKTNYKALQSDMEKHKLELEAKLKSHQELLSSATVDNAKLTSDLAAKSEKLSEKNQRILDLEKKSEEIERSLDLLKAANDKMKLENLVIKRERSKIEADNQLLEANKRSSELKLIDVETNLTNVNASLSKVLADANASKTKIAQLEASLVAVERDLIILCEEYGISTGKGTKDIVFDIKSLLGKIKSKRVDLETLLERYADLLRKALANNEKDPAIPIYRTCLHILTYATSSEFGSEFDFVQAKVLQNIESVKALVSTPYASVRYIDAEKPTPTNTSTTTTTSRTTSTTTTPITATATTTTEKFGSKAQSVFSISDEWDTNSDTGSESSESGYEV